MSIGTTLSNIERHEQVLRYVEQRQRVTVADICGQFGVSVATARRDLEVLANDGRVRRVHGGALAIHHAPPELPALERANEQANEKRRIGQATASLVRDGETVFLSSGTTTLEVARSLRGRRLTVITNSLLVLNELADVSDITLVALGGLLRRSEMSFIGHVTEQALAGVRADKVIIGIRAIDAEHGLTNDFLPETMTDRAIMQIAREVIVVADHTKCERVSAAFVAPLTIMHTLVTDTRTAPEFVQALATQGIRVVTV